MRALLPRVAGLLSVCAVLVVGPAAPAVAHGPTPDGTNYRSTVTGVVDSDGAQVRVAGVTWQVLGGDGLLHVRTDGGAEVVVTGYDDEPFLRVGPDGVFENRNSPATYLNADRFANGTVPPEVDAAAAPDWRRLSDGTRWQWHDHRIHWMAPTPPAAVRNRPGVEQRILEWTVPFEADGQALEAHGVLQYVPPPPVWPWLLGAAVVLTLPIGIALLGGVGARQVLRTLVVVTVATAGAGLVVAVGDALATPASVGANAWAIFQTAAPAAIAVALAWTTWRPASSDDGARPESTLVVAAVIIAFAGGIARLSQLTSSQVINVLPTLVVRSVAAASLAVVVPAVVVALAQRPARQAAA